MTSENCFSTGKADATGENARFQAEMGIFPSELLRISPYRTAVPRLLARRGFHPPENQARGVENGGAACAHFIQGKTGILRLLYQPIYFQLSVMTAPDLPVFATCDICDAFEDDTSGDIRVLPPVFKDFGAVTRFCGPVVTLRCPEDNSRVREAVNSTGYVDTPTGRVGRVLVVDGAGSVRRALVGGNLAAAAARNGWAGIVVDGAVRDVAELNQARLGLRALALMPMRTAKRGEGQADLPVQIQGVWVRPGDWLYADEDGVVVSARPVHG